MLIKQVFPESLVSPSTYCRFFYRGEQSVGDVENKNAAGVLAVKNTGFLDATLWATPGYMAVGGTAGNYCTVAAAAHDFSLVDYTMVYTVRIKKAAVTFPAAEQYIISSYNPGSTTGGIIVSCRTDGVARMYANAADGTTVNVSTAANVITNGSAAPERSLVFILPRDSGSSAWVAVDAIEAASSSAATIVGKSFVGARDLRIGQGQATTAIDAYQLAAVAAYAVPNNLANIDRRQIYDWALRNPGQPIPDWVFA